MPALALNSVGRGHHDRGGVMETGRGQGFKQVGLRENWMDTYSDAILIQLSYLFYPNNSSLTLS